MGWGWLWCGPKPMAASGSGCPGSGGTGAHPHLAIPARYSQPPDPVGQETWQTGHCEERWSIVFSASTRLRGRRLGLIRSPQLSRADLRWRDRIPGGPANKDGEEHWLMRQEDPQQLTRVLGTVEKARILPEWRLSCEQDFSVTVNLTLFRTMGYWHPKGTLSFQLSENCTLEGIAKELVTTCGGLPGPSQRVLSFL